jgi:NAD(P)-dependent dehydrogenase (short-subunit alcohol dehydrogenase family)
METSNTLLTNKVAVVTGAGDGIGKGIALMFARSGAHVVVADRNAAAGEAAAAEINSLGRKGLAIHTDIRRSDQVGALITRTVAELGGVDILVNNVGGSPRQPFLDNGETRWQKIVELNLMSVFYCTGAVVHHMIERKRGGAIVNISSIEGSRAAPGFAVYSACKGGMDTFTKTAALEFAAHGIRVNCIAPNAVTRPSTSAAKPNITTTAPQDPARVQAMQASLVSPMVAYLAHEDCMVNGEILVAGGRRFARWFLAVTPGYRSAGEGAPTIEEIAGHWDEINDENGYYVPESLHDWASEFLGHLSR